jgi:hypothetical protein
MYATFQYLMREKYSRLKMVPIHEVRKVIRETYGDKAASHEVFDELLKEIRWKDKNIVITTIADTIMHTKEQLDDSIDSLSDTLFYIRNPYR